MCAISRHLWIPMVFNEQQAVIVFTDFSSQGNLDLAHSSLTQMGSVSFWPVPMVFKEHLFTPWHKMFEAHCVPFMLQLQGQPVLPRSCSWVEKEMYKKQWSIILLIWGMLLTQACSWMECQAGKSTKNHTKWFLYCLEKGIIDVNTNWCFHYYCIHMCTLNTMRLLNTSLSI